jgi:hypothetical protein
MKPEVSTMEGPWIRYAAMRNPGKPQVVWTPPQPKNTLSFGA